MEDKMNNGQEREGFLFHHLVAMFQTLALQQLGKLVNPITNKLERDLQQAKITIDMISMIQQKTSGNLDDDEKRLLDVVLMDLQMNYIDELNRGDDDKNDDSDRSAGSEKKAEESEEQSEKEEPGEK